MVARSKLLTPATPLADRRPFPRRWLPHVASRHAASAAVTRRLADKAVIARRRTVTHHARCAPCPPATPSPHAAIIGRERDNGSILSTTWGPPSASPYKRKKMDMKKKEYGTTLPDPSGSGLSNSGGGVLYPCHVGVGAHTLWGLPAMHT
jgi:hypothetical protein